MPFVFRITETASSSQSWLVLLGNGRYFASTGSAAPNTWQPADEALPVGEFWGRNTNQIIQAWSTPTNIATNGDGTYAATKPSGAISGDGKQYVYNTGEDPPSGNWNGITSGDFRQVIYDEANSRFVRLDQNTMQGRTFMAFSSDGVTYDTSFRMATGQYTVHHAVIDNGVWLGVYQNTESDPSGLKGNRILVNSGSNFPESSTYVASVPNSGQSRISRPHYGNSVWLAGYTSGVLKSTNGGASWSTVTISHGGTNCRIQGVAYSAAKNTWIAVGTIGTDVNNGTGIILRSLDDGSTWSTVKTGGVANGGFFCVATSDDGIWLVGGQNREVYRSINDGLNWVGPISSIHSDVYSGGNQHYDVIAILFETNKNV